MGLQKVSEGKFIWFTTGVCAKTIDIQVNEDQTIKSVLFNGGCPGNAIGLSKMVQGQDIIKVANMLRGVKCGNKITSCPDQLSRALEAIKEVL